MELLHHQLLKEFRSTFGQYDEVEMKFPLWLKRTTGKFPWENIFDKPNKPLKMQHDDICSICLESDWNKAVQLNCGHIFHHACAKTWFEKKENCSICRASTTCCNNIIVLPATPQKRTRNEPNSPSKRSK
jgi:hypothetical protein